MLFANTNFDITVDENRFLSYPCMIEDQGLHLSKKTKKEGKLNKTKVDQTDDLNKLSKEHSSRS
jgi:hypothetical protein